MTQIITCSSCKKNESVYNEKSKSYYKSCYECRNKKKKKSLSIKSDNQYNVSIESDNQDNVSTKSSTHQSQTSALKSLQILTNNSNSTNFYNIGSPDYDESEQRKPTINEQLEHINMSLDQLTNAMTNNLIRGTGNDDIELLKSRIDNIEVMLEQQNKFISDIEANIKHCRYQIYCSCENRN